MNEVRASCIVGRSGKVLPLSSDLTGMLAAEQDEKNTASFPPRSGTLGGRHLCPDGLSSEPVDSPQKMKPGTSSVSAVLVGRFAPDDFSIDALAQCKAVAAGDLDAARYEAFLKGQVSSVRFPWGKLAVTGEKLICEVKEAPYIRAADLALKCLREVSLTGTVRLLGINYVAHFEIADDSKRDEIGRRLMPPANWGSWGADVEESFRYPATDSRHGGMITAVMRQGVPDDRPGGHMDVRVEPALRGSVMGVLVSVNDHYEVPPKSLSERTITSMLLDCLELNFDRSIDRSMSVAEELMG